jgi:hypothetical protein
MDPALVKFCQLLLRQAQLMQRAHWELGFLRLTGLLFLFRFEQIMWCLPPEPASLGPASGRQGLEALKAHWLDHVDAGLTRIDKAIEWEMTELMTEPDRCLFKYRLPDMQDTPRHIQVSPKLARQRSFLIFRPLLEELRLDPNAVLSNVLAGYRQANNYLRSSDSSLRPRPHSDSPDMADCDANPNDSDGGANGESNSDPSSSDSHTSGDEDRQDRVWHYKFSDLHSGVLMGYGLLEHYGAAAYHPMMALGRFGTATDLLDNVGQILDSVDNLALVCDLRRWLYVVLHRQTGALRKRRRRQILLGLALDLRHQCVLPRWPVLSTITWHYFLLSANRGLLA